jgi:hypothetical protein
MKKLSWRFTPSIVEWACLFAGGFLVFWYAWIIDDAYVYFRYVDNLVIHRQGLVWNVGEYVEGFSSPLWTLLLSLLRLFHLNYWIIILIVGLLSYFIFWWLACLVNREFVFGAKKNNQNFSLNIPLAGLYPNRTFQVE